MNSTNHPPAVVCPHWGPNGDIQLQADDWWSSSEILSMAPFPYNGTSNANWPVLPELSGPLTEGTWTFRFKTLSPINYSDDHRCS